jgi:hypothetical protein
MKLALLDDSWCGQSVADPRERSVGSALGAAATDWEQGRLQPRGRSRTELNPLPLGFAAAGITELSAGVRLAGRTWHLGRSAREVAAVRVVQAGALVACSRRRDWRVPLISLVIALRFLGLVAALTSRSSGAERRGGLQLRIVWLLALSQLRREAARAETWEH